MACDSPLRRMLHASLHPSKTSLVRAPSAVARDAPNACPALLNNPQPNTPLPMPSAYPPAPPVSASMPVSSPLAAGNSFPSSHVDSVFSSSPTPLRAVRIALRKCPLTIDLICVAAYTEKRQLERRRPECLPRRCCHCGKSLSGALAPVSLSCGMLIVLVARRTQATAWCESRCS